MLEAYFADCLARMDAMLAQQGTAAQRLIDFFGDWLESQTGDEAQSRCLAVKLGAEVCDLSESMRAALERGTRGVVERLARCTWGHFRQFVTRVENEDVLEGSRDFWLLADDELLPIESEHRIVGASYAGHHALFNIELYDKRFENLTLFSTRYRVDPSADPSELFFTGSGRAQGLEVLVQRLTGPLTGWVSYGLSRVVHEFPDVDDGAEFPASHAANRAAPGKGQTSDWPFPLWLFALIPVGWVGGAWLVGRRGAWNRLARAYAAPRPHIGKRVHFGSAIVGTFKYGNALFLHTDASHLHLSVLPIIRLGHPPLGVPWSEISASPAKLGSFSVVRLTFANDPGVRFLLAPAVARRVIAASAGALRLSEADVPQSPQAPHMG